MRGGRANRQNLLNAHVPVLQVRRGEPADVLHVVDAVHDGKRDRQAPCAGRLAPAAPCVCAYAWLPRAAPCAWAPGTAAPPPPPPPPSLTQTVLVCVTRRNAAYGTPAHCVKFMGEFAGASPDQLQLYVEKVGRMPPPLRRFSGFEHTHVEAVHARVPPALRACRSRAADGRSCRRGYLGRARLCAAGRAWWLRSTKSQRRNTSR